ncbi:hypothetical protein HAX54_041463 [Datura stramonium]|uniref:Uncharacterized protein n=1 Tax=Datura stramonium TaxID=4076 RepID=A0ABS8SLC2_DATST|nr:hypothetical protein [Datura stramonium]
MGCNQCGHRRHEAKSTKIHPAWVFSIKVASIFSAQPPNMFYYMYLCQDFTILKVNCLDRPIGDSMLSIDKRRCQKPPCEREKDRLKSNERKYVLEVFFIRRFDQ